MPTIAASAVAADPLDKNARLLVTAAHCTAISLTDFRSEFACVAELDDPWWDFFVTAACVHVGLVRLGTLDPERGDRLREIVFSELGRWPRPGSQNIFEALVDFDCFFERTYEGSEASDDEDEQRFVTADLLGTWVVWHLLDRRPRADEERRLARALGVMALHHFADWWDTAV